MDIRKSENIREFVAIEFPGRVNNVDNMIESLNGIQELSRAFDEKQKLQLKLHPKNFYNKAIISSEQLVTTGMLLKVKVRRPKKKNSEKQFEFLSAELHGLVSTIYKFNNFCDYQFLPLQKNEKTGKTEYIYEDVIPKDILAGPSWFREKPDMPLFLPPVQFSRTDMFQPGSLNNEKQALGDNDETVKLTARSSRMTHSTNIVFDMHSPIPTAPKQSAMDFLSSSLPKDFEVINQLFKDRPIWTLSAIRAHVREPPKRLSNLLAAIGFFYSTGPWRNCFVRYGYDPRKNFESRFYQMIDYRVRQGAGFNCEMKRKRTSAISKRVKVYQKTDGDLEEADIEENFQLRRKEAIFNEDTIPPFRARHYQFVDIHVDEIQEMLKKIPAPIDENSCNERRGWLPGHFMENVREILTRIAQANMMKLCKEKQISIDEFNEKLNEESKVDDIDQEQEESLSEGEDLSNEDEDEN